ncbi:MAG: porin family protein [Prevotella sp.]|nr:porin family protein [Prevotella sp.]MBQ4413114.1 porin family protein [Prevotella sp.]MBQ6054714.1 porin family protein [Prevotella sp.]MBR0389137.1 porin family protein [Prevotella sp.]
MKKFFTLVVLLATMTVAAQAQVKFGVKGGLNLTNMKFDNSIVDKSNQTGFFIGPTINFTLPVVGLGIDASALYDQRSAEVNDEKLKQQSIQIPINLRYGFGLGNTASIYIFAGPQFGFNVGDKKTNLVNEALDWRMKDSSLSANVGLGLMLLNHLQVSANYNIAMGTTGEFDILKDVPDAAWKQVTGKTKANSWQLSVAYFF